MGAFPAVQAPLQQGSSPSASLLACAAKGSQQLGKQLSDLLFPRRFPYYIGVVGKLTSLRIMTPKTPVAGASAGSLIAACHHAGLTEKQVTCQCILTQSDNNCHPSSALIAWSHSPIKFTLWETKQIVDTVAHAWPLCTVGLADDGIVTLSSSKQCNSHWARIHTTVAAW